MMRLCNYNKVVQKLSHLQTFLTHSMVIESRCYLCGYKCWYLPEAH